MEHISDLFKRYNHLAFNTPFCVGGTNTKVKSTFLGISEACAEPLSIDCAAISQILNVGYCFGNRTLVKQVARTPWMAKPGPEERNWVYAKLPQHGGFVASPECIAENLFRLLCDEIKTYAKDKETLGILLSGGMDSRIVAIVVNHLKVAGELSADVVGLTWGVQASRDVVYGRRVADVYKWGWCHYELNEELLFNNISIAAENGAEYSPIHLHAMPLVSQQKGIDGILAGSYGDSVGRAEYSGTHLTKIASIDNHFFNRFKFLYQRKFEQCIGAKDDDLGCYARQFDRKERWQQFEVQRQSHYMRRMLNPCMNVINEKIELYQAFTSPEVFGYMWSLNPSCRTDEPYFHILLKYGKEVADVPWARTGVRYFGRDGSEHPDVFSSLNNRYGSWIRTSLHTEIEKAVLSPAIESLNIFNVSSLKKLLRFNRRSTQDSVTKLDENLIWIASLSKFIEMYSVSTEYEHDINFSDSFDASILAGLYAKTYEGKRFIGGLSKKVKDLI